ncbi:MAG: hypothetical protein IJU31_05215 [Synergistaceae bacterium]|nr:hypothetical protein [Synergistaceae bacterium]
MKKFIIALLLVCVGCGGAAGELPKTYKEFKARYQTEGKSVQGAVKLYFEGVFAFMNEETRKEGGKMLRYSLHSEVPIERSTYYATFVERMKDPDYNYMFRSYMKGSKPENDYKMSPDNFEITYAGKPVKDPGGFLRVQLQSSGADSPRIIWVKKYDDGLWYIINNSATYVQVKEPRTETVRRSHAHDADYDEDDDAKPDEPKEPQELEELPQISGDVLMNPTPTPKQEEEDEDFDW